MTSGFGMLVGAALALSLVGCADGDMDQQVSGTGVAATGGPQTPGGTPDAVGGRGDVSDDPVLSAIVLQYGLSVSDLPAVTVVRAVSPSEQDAQVDLCMAEQGWDRDPGSQMYFIPEGQERAFGVAQYVCFSEYPLAAQCVEPLSPDQIRAVVDFWRDELIGCLTAKGYEPTVPLPSWVVFEQSWNTAAMFDPYSGVPPTLSNMDRAQLELDRPAFPSDEVLYDGD